jgi:prophage regulatory protein
VSEAVNQERFLSVKEIEGIVGWTRQHIAREERAGRFPKRVQVGPNTVRWSSVEINAWLQERKSRREAA